MKEEPIELDEVKIEPSASRKEAEQILSRKFKKNKDTERWISRSFAEHQIIIETPEGSDVVRFKDYCVDVNLSTKAGQVISKGLHSCSREGRDIFVVGDAYDENDLGNRAEMLKKLRSMNVKQLRSLLTYDEMESGGIPAGTVDPDTLITLIIKMKSI